jgi:nucleoside 2-deoxyribosyltransferase
MTEKRHAFVIMPFHIEFNSIYQELIKRPLEDVGYEVTRADSLMDQQNILSSIVQGITKADVVIADLTLTNANVFYELGLCHGLGVPVILIAQSITDVPFDLRSYKIHIYETHFDKIGKLRDFLRNIVIRHQAGEIVFSNPIKDFSIHSIQPDVIPAVTAAAQPRTEEPTDPRTGDDPKELWDFLADAEKATEDLSKLLNELLKANSVVTNKITKHTANLQMLSNNPTAGSASRFQKVSILASSDINRFSKTVEDMLPRFENTIDRLSDNYAGFLEFVNPDTGSDYDSIVNLRTTINDLFGGAKEARRAFYSFRDAAIDLANKKASKDLSRAARRQAEALGGVIDNIERVEAFCSKALNIIDSKLDRTDRASKAPQESTPTEVEQVKD